MNAEEMFKKLGYKKTEESEGALLYTSEFENNILFDMKRVTINDLYCNGGITINRLLENAIHKQCEELGWIEEEQKQETNFEHYKDEIIEVCIEDLAISKGRMTQCCGILCSECGFTDENGDCIGHRRIIEWLKKPYQKQTYKLTKFEFDLIQTYHDCHESCKLSEFKQLIELKDKGYFQCVDHDTKIQDVLKNCEVTE